MGTVTQSVTSCKITKQDIDLISPLLLTSGVVSGPGMCEGRVKRATAPSPKF